MREFTRNFKARKTHKKGFSSYCSLNTTVKRRTPNDQNLFALLAGYKSDLNTFHRNFTDSYNVV